VLSISDHGEELTGNDIDQLAEGIQQRGEKVTALLNQLIAESEKIMDKG